ncbi:ghmp kinase [beta proteobacterium KB13]|uniref:Ghmp kinase n=1 Tax=beta proteobacterium KB13 TaxID=314607 RepID=B6BTL1_9PROT|nr:ghmp kinase [beta proteobacterium KB13]
MIISKTPFRVSLFGGGTDFPDWFLENGGEVVSMSIDKYCYISVRKLPPFFDHIHRIVYSRIENVKDVNDIQHPVVRALLKKYYFKGLEIHHDADLPARSGLGSSSAFTVGLIKALSAKKGKLITKKQLACDAIDLERNILKENVGLQDQIAVSYGGLNNIKFHKNFDNNFVVNPIPISNKILEELNSSLLLVFTGISRFSSVIQGDTLAAIKKNYSNLSEIAKIAKIGLKKFIDQDGDIINELGLLLDETWQLKKKLSTSVSNNLIDDLYNLAKKNGAIGGKVLGAGGGGFVLLVAKKENIDALKKAMSKFVVVPFNIDNTGSVVSYYQPDRDY